MTEEFYQKLTEREKETVDYMKKNYNGRCAYKPTRICDGLCNNCPHGVVFDEISHPIATVVSSGSGPLFGQYGDCDYERLILERHDYEECW